MLIRTAKAMFLLGLNVISVSMLVFKGGEAFSQPETGIEDEIKQLRQEIRTLQGSLPTPA